ncbi:MAG: DUF4838 domain-containing protein, partial [bacterium]|nr:DUF4838 domain-containing protein [bacterium]
MVRQFTSVLTLAVLCAASFVAMAADFVIVEGGASQCAIVVPDGAPDKVCDAAEDLRHFVERMTGCALEVANESEAPEGSAIFFGETQRAKDAGLTVDQGPFPTAERCRIVVRDGDLFLLGNDAWVYDGTAHAVFGLLDRFGCRWFMPGPLGEDIPRVERLAVEALDVDETPDFVERSGVWYEYHNENSDEAHAALGEWRRRNRMGARWLPIGHNIKRIMPVDPYFEQHPEWYPEFGGKRKTEGLEGGMWHPCVSNEALREFVAKRTADVFRESEDVRGYSLALNDAGWQGWCQCAACKAMNETTNGERGRGFTKRYLTFVDDVARRVQDEFPDRLVTASAYASTQAPPEDMAPLNDNVFLVIMHYYWCDQCNPFREDPFYKGVFEGFAKLTPNRLGVYEYYGDFHYDQLPVAAWSFMDDDFDFFADNGVRMMTIEGGNHWAANLLTYYVAAKKTWD